MTCTITNRSGRLVSFRGNGGQTWHLAPFASIEVVDVEVTENRKIQKLEAHGLITVEKAEAEAPDRGEPQRARTTRSRHARER